MTSRLAERLGVQAPRVLARPQGVVRSSGPEAAELAAACGLVLDPWQELTLDVAMGERADGSWAAGEVGLIASRQNGKNGVVEALELYGLTVENEWIIHTAHLFPTARESYVRLLALIEAHPDTKNSLVYNVASPASGYEMRFRGGGRIRFIARSRSSGRGLTGDKLICDEAQDLSDDSLGALLPTVSARPGAQTWYLGSAPNETSTVFHRVRKRGRDGSDPRLAYLEFSADPGSDLDDRGAWAQANPSYNYDHPHAITDEAVVAERGSMSDELFARERLSISPDLVTGGGVISLEQWAACLDERSGPVGSVAFALDVNKERTWASFGVAGDSGRGGTHVELIERRPGTAGLVERAKELQTQWGGPLAVSTGSPAASFIPDLEAANVRVVEIANAESAQACGQFYDAVIRGEVKHLDQPELALAVKDAARKFYGDVWYWSLSLSKGDITPVRAVTLAKWVHDQDTAMAVPECVVY